MRTVRRNPASGDGQTDEVLKARFWNKPQVLELAAKHLGLVKEGGDLNVSVMPIDELIKEPQAGRERCRLQRQSLRLPEPPALPPARPG